MPEHSISFQDALTLLEVTNPDGLTAEALPHLKRRAMKRWHPDTIAALSPSPARLQHYASQFRLIEPALDLIRSHVDGSRPGGPATSPEPAEPPTAEEPAEIVRRNAANLQATLWSAWGHVQETGYKMEETEVVLSAGLSVAEMLRRDLADEVPVLILASVVGGTVAYSPLLLIPETRLFGAGLLGVHWFFGLLALLPLARLWLPRFVSAPTGFFFSVGLFLYNYLARQSNELARFGLFPIAWLFWIVLRVPITLARLLLRLILPPVYGLLGWLFAWKRIGVMRTTVKYYAGLAEWYVEEILARNPEAMSPAELLHLAHLYREYREVPIRS